MIEPGIYRDLPASKYHEKTIGVVSKSALDQIAPQKTPAHYYAWATGESERVDTPAMAFGRAGHCAVFEPDVFASTYAVQPDFGDCRYKAARQARDEWRAENEGREFLSASDWRAIQQIQQSMRSNRLMSALLEDGMAELSVVWDDVETGLRCKCRADFYSEKHATLVDLKLVEDASDVGFARSVLKYRYHVQDALYRTGFNAAGLPVKSFVFLAIEKRAPYAGALYMLDSEALVEGTEAMVSDMRIMADCVASGKWPAYSTSIQTLTLPRRK